MAAMAQSAPRQKRSCYAATQRLYRFMGNKRIRPRLLFKGMYRIAQQTVAAENPPYLVIAVDPVNLEKPYTQTLEGVSTVHKSTSPDKDGQARLQNLPL